jgi:hypothetical protein
MKLNKKCKNDTPKKKMHAESTCKSRNRREGEGRRIS